MEYQNVYIDKYLFICRGGILPSYIQNHDLQLNINLFFAHSLAHGPSHTLTHSFIHSLAYSFTHLFWQFFI